MKTLALYLRLSKEDMNEGESNSISNQRDLLLNYISTQADLKDYAKLEFIDDGISGATFDRPALNNLLSLAGKTIDVILVKDISRFGRNLIKVGDYIDQIFPELGVRFISVNDDYDSNNFKGLTASIDVGLKAFIHEMYSRDCSNKIRASKRTKLRNGEYIGALPFYGYIKSDTEKNKLIPNPDTAPIVRYIFKLASDGYTAMEITKKLNKENILSPRMYLKSKGLDKLRGTKAVKADEGIWIISTVRRILYDERYTGVQISGKTERVSLSSKKIVKVPSKDWIVTLNAHEPIVSKDEWEKANTIFNKKGVSVKAKDKSRNIFKGLIKCGYCNRTLSLYKDQKEPCYRCNTHKFTHDAICKEIRLNEEKLKSFILDKLYTQIRMFLNCKPNKEVNQNFEKDIAMVDSNIKQLKCQKTSLFEELADEKLSVDEFKAKSNKIANEIEVLEQRRKEFLKKLNKKHLAKTSKSLDLGRYSDITELSIELVQLLISKITVYDEKSIEITWNFKSFAKV